MAEQIAKKVAEHCKDNVLFEFLANIQRKTLFQEDEEQIKNLEMGVKEIVQKIIDVFYTDGKYQFEEMIHVGSSYDGSKIISPDEFDFMLVLKNLSRPGKLHIAEGCQPGMKLIRYKKFERSDSSGPNLVFNNVLGLEIDSVMTSSNVRRAKQKTIRVQTDLGELQIKDMFRCTLHLECVNNDRQFAIKVDLMPSVRIPCETKEVTKDMSLCPAEIRYLAFKDGCFLVGKLCVVDGMCWQLSFAAAERNMMKALSPGHMKTYRVLKYLFVEKSVIGICDLISSYILKTALLRHAYFQCEEVKPGGCFVAVLRSIAASMGSAFMKSLFVPSLNLWQRVIQEKMRNITENDTIFDKFVRDQLSLILKTEGRELKDALTITVIFDFWKRVFLLLADIFESTDLESLTKASLERVLRTVYATLNEEDEEDDLDKDFFKQEATVNTSLYENDDWEIFRPSTNLRKSAYSTRESCASALNESKFVSVEGTECMDFTIDDAAENDGTSGDESQDLKDMESFVNTYVKETGENFDSDSDDGNGDSLSDEEDSEDGDEMYVQAEQEDVYQLYVKYRADICTVNIPVFTELLGRILKAASCKCIQSLTDKFRAGQIAPYSYERTGDLKKRKLSND